MRTKKPDGWDLPYKFRQRLDRMSAHASQLVWANGGKREYDWWKRASRWGFVQEDATLTSSGPQRYSKFVRTSKPIEVGLPAVYGFYFLPEHRQVLASWPAGEVRDIEVFSNNLNKKLWEEGEGEGYYQILSEIDDTHLTIKRTFKPMRPYRPRTLAPPTQDGVWPWKPNIHWERMKSNPIRKSQEVTRQFTGKRSDFRLHILYPTVIRELGQLRKVRDDLEKVFRRVVPIGWRSDSPLTDRFLGNGVTARILFLDLMAEPIFDNNGRFLNFQELSAEQVAREYSILGGGIGDDAVAKYKNFMREYWNGSR